MKYIAFQNRKTGLLLAGTDFNFSPPRHRYADQDHAPLLIGVDGEIIKHSTAVCEMLRRNITPRAFRIVTVRVELAEHDQALEAELFAECQQRRAERGF